MTNPDIECLPTDFVGISRPSKRLEALYQKKEREQVEAIKELEDKKLEICKRYEKLIEKRSEQISRNLEEMRTTLKDEMYNFKIEMFRDQASIDKYEFKKIYKKVLLQAEQHHSLIETFYKDLCEMEKNKSKELTIALKFTYNAIKSISLKLPKENDEWVELEIEKLNQTILCNNRNYLELKTQFQTAVQNDTKLKISDLQNIKENWIKISKERSQQAADDLKEKYVSEMTKMADKLKTETMDKMLNVLPSVASLPNRQNPEEWLENIRLTLATLDQKSQKIMMSYKQAAVVIYNRFFQELKVLKETLDEIGEGEQISKGQASMYTPDLDEIRLNYGDDLERIKVVWDEVVEQISKTVDNTHDFLVAATSLWEDHFCRTKVLQIIVLKDIENTVKKHNTLSELCETKVNILIDTLRQEPSKEKLKKTLEDLKKSLSSIEVLYKTQYQAEVNVLKKFNSMQELKADILVAEIKRFLEVYPPDMEKDPKIQRKRASQTSETTNSTDNLIPNQLIYCKFQIGAVSNWQFGLWECIGNYMTNAKADILAETDKWIQTHINYIDTRLKIRMAIHDQRLEKIMAFIYQQRLDELCLHQKRFEEHKIAVEKRTIELKDEYKLYQDKYRDIVNKFKEESTDVELKCVDSKNSYEVATMKPLLNNKMDQCIQKFDNLNNEYLEKCQHFLNSVKASHIIFAKNMKLFSEQGNFSVIEIKDVLKNMEKIEAQVEKTIVTINKEIEECKCEKLQQIKNKFDEVYYSINKILEEYKFVGDLDEMQKKLKYDLSKQVCTFQYKLKSIITQYKKTKKEILANVGSFHYFKTFVEAIEDIIKKLRLLSDFLDLPEPVVFYSDKSSSTSTDRSIKPRQSSMGRGPQYIENYANKLESQIFNFNLDSQTSSYFNKLNQILKEYWNNVINCTKTFFVHLPRCIYLEDKVFSGPVALMKDLHSKMLDYQSQCETRIMQDTKEYLFFTITFIIFLQDYLDMYPEEYSRKFLKHFENVFENEIKRDLQKHKEDIRDKFEDLQKKLKTWYGHPQHRGILEKLQIEAEILTSEAKETCEDIKYPYLAKLEQEYNRAILEYNDLKENLVPVLDAP
ncbi:uncharacterized protein LOC126740337 isoform X2 [Anthonomus grandis grandis]|uniref:uncharacterized protein LOC126740337 isoform X2 n=1 Tax=Anthonomus grandis grandis TaxID=2921223 RepID=UPI00216667F1|nr:uncharacterized protein LOC126740337 isoform X2 [Anthonomus grandis grandis]